MTTQARELAKLVTNAGDLNLVDDISLASDGAILNFGADSDVNLTHVADTGLLLNSSRQLQFGDSGTHIRQSADGVLQLTSDTEVEINATTVDINANVDVSGNIVLGGTITVGDADDDNMVINANVNSHIIPNTDDTFDLGSSGQQWRNVYVDGTLEADAITVADTALAEYISDTVGAMVGSNTESGITVAYQDGDNTLDFTVGTLNQDTTGTADNITISANNSTDETVYPIFVDGATGSQGAESDTGLTYNPSSGIITATQFTGAVTGDVTGNVSGTAATVTGAAQSSITSLGTLTTLTVDNVIINGTTIGHTSDTDLMTLASGNLTVTGDITQADGDYLYTGGGNFDIKHNTASQNMVFSTTPSGGSATERMRVKHDGTVGIGTTAPDVLLEIAGAHTSSIGMLHLDSSDHAFISLDAASSSHDKGIYFQEAGTAQVIIDHDGSANLLRIHDGSNTHMVIEDGGDVGIGTASPASLLHIESSTAWGAQLMINQDDAGTTGAQLFLKHTSSSPADNDYIGFINFKGENDADQEVQYARIHAESADVTDGTEDGSLFFNTAVAGTENTSVMSMVGGKVGIGETSPDKHLHIKNTASGATGIAIENTNNAQNLEIDFYNNAGAAQGRIRYYEGAGDISLNPNVSGSDPFTVKWDGKVGIGTTSPGSVLNVKTTKTVALSSAAHFLTLGLTIDDSTAYDTAGGGGGIAFRTPRNSSGTQTVFAAIDGAKEGTSNDGYTGALRFYTNQNSTGVPLERMRIDSAGDVLIGQTSQTGYTFAQKLVVGDGDANDGITIQSGSTHQGNLAFNHSDGTTAHGRILYQHNTNYMSFFTNNAEKMRIDTNGKVGIGTDSPDGKLSVTSTGNASEDVLYLKSGADNVNEYLGIAFETAIGGNGPHGAVRVYNGPSANDSYMSLLTTTDGGTLTQGLTQDHLGNIGIGTTAPSDLLHVRETNAAAQIRIQRHEVDGILDDNDEIGALEFWTNDDTYSSGASVLRAKIMAEVQNTSSGTNLQFWTGNSTSAAAERMRIIADGKVGIATSTPAGNLDVNGTSYFRNTLHLAGSGQVQWVGGVYHTLIESGNNLILKRSDTLATIGTWDSSGNYTASDQRFKDNITTITGATAKVKQLRGVTHTWKEALQDPEDADRVMYGLIAQEVETVIPELVHTDDLNDGYKSVSYEKLVPLLIETIKELEARIKTLEDA